MCADWSAGRKGRAAWAADLYEQAVFRLDPPARGWTAGALLAEADAMRGDEAALVCFDAPLGVPESFLRAWGFSSFPWWLMAADFDRLFEPVDSPEDWSPERPFVRPRRGGWKGVLAAADVVGLTLWRDVDRLTGAESMFKLVGAKQVGRAAQELWRELRRSRLEGHAFRLWPFEADLDAAGVVVAEIYPRTAYEEVLGRTALRKRDPAARREAALLLRPEVRETVAAAATEDDLDAAVSAVAILRRLAGGRVLAVEAHVDRKAEGGILCT